MVSVFITLSLSPPILQTPRDSWDAQSLTGWSDAPVAQRDKDGKKGDHGADEGLRGWSKLRGWEKGMQGEAATIQGWPPATGFI